MDANEIICFGRDADFIVCFYHQNCLSVHQKTWVCVVCGVVVAGDGGWGGVGGGVVLRQLMNYDSNRKCIECRNLSLLADFISSDRLGTVNPS